MANSTEDLVFKNLNADDVDHTVTEIESCCMNCYKNGTTRMLLTKIPFYKETIIVSFSCEHCGYENNEIQPAAEIEPNGCQITLKVKTVKDLNRRVVKSDRTSVRFVELDFEIPSQSQKGEVTTIESIINRSIAGLEQDQPVRRVQHPDAAAQIDAFVEKLRSLKSVDTPFTIVFEDISGNCRVENLNAPNPDPDCIMTHFNRTIEQNHELGMFTQTELNEESEAKAENSTNILKPIAEDEWPLEELHGEVLQFHTDCPSCKSKCETNMKLTNIPHFKEVVIMSTNCDVCGARTNEVKSGSGIEDQGVRITVKIDGREDMSRDVLKSDTCTIDIPELDSEFGASGLGGRFTTVEGILDAIREQIIDNSAVFHDSADVESKLKIDKFSETLQEIMSGKRAVTLILDDPAGNSYVQALTDDGSLDERLKIERYDRSFEQNEELGLNDMKTENYS
ncbi:zinc finger protein ZPR1 [Sitodiplosis mosellana]|uniref:zinc finger protein ZPR1 n=1 Tax=Sitodiplosis mosellana TaxID=263140 RepID=UPI002444D416|nr:zinc finger protein ZPR1 [Sitodiplosis mosellana]